MKVQTLLCFTLFSYHSDFSDSTVKSDMPVSKEFMIYIWISKAVEILVYLYVKSVGNEQGAVFLNRLRNTWKYIKLRIFSFISERGRFPGTRVDLCTMHTIRPPGVSHATSADFRKSFLLLICCIILDYLYCYSSNVSILSFLFQGTKFESNTPVRWSFGWIQNAQCLR